MSNFLKTLSNTLSLPELAAKHQSAIWKANPPLLSVYKRWVLTALKTDS
jgi:hypothetical protein